MHCVLMSDLSSLSILIWLIRGGKRVAYLIWSDLRPLFRSSLTTGGSRGFHTVGNLNPSPSRPHQPPHPCGQDKRGFRKTSDNTMGNQEKSTQRAVCKTLLIPHKHKKKNADRWLRPLARHFWRNEQQDISLVRLLYERFLDSGDQGS